MDFTIIFNNVLFIIILVNWYNILFSIIGILLFLLKLFIHYFYNIVIIVSLFIFLNHIFIYEGLNKSTPPITCNCLFIMQDNILKKFVVND